MCSAVCLCVFVRLCVFWSVSVCFDACLCFLRFVCVFSCVYVCFRACLCVTVRVCVFSCVYVLVFVFHRCVCKFFFVMFIKFFSDCALEALKLKLVITHGWKNNQTSAQLRL